MKTENNRKTIQIDLGFIGSKAEKLQSFFNGYSTEPNPKGLLFSFSQLFSFDN